MIKYSFYSNNSLTVYKNIEWLKYIIFYTKSNKINNRTAQLQNTAVKEASNPTKKKATKKETQGQKRKSEGPSSSETPPKKTKGGGASSKPVASDTSIMETINNVIQQSLQMSQKPTKMKKQPKANNVSAKVEKKNKKNSNGNLLSTIKRASKKLDLVKSVVSEKIGMIKNEIKNSQQKINKVDAKLKMKVKAKNGKVKAKLLEVKSKVLETKNNNNNKLPEVKNNKALEIKNNKNAEIKNNKILETKTKVSESKALEPKAPETKAAKPVELKTKLHGKKHQEPKDTKEPKEVKEPKETKANVVFIPVKEVKATKVKDAKTGGKVAIMLHEGNTKCKKKGKGPKKSAGRRDSIICKQQLEEQQSREIASKCLSMSRRPFLKPKWSNGWSWEGEAFEAKVYLTVSLFLSICFSFNVLLYFFFFFI